MTVQYRAADERALRWGCRRGMRELDVLLSGWLDTGWANADARQRRAFERLLECEDAELWDWLSGRGEPRSADLRAIIEVLRNHAGD